MAEYFGIYEINKSSEIKLNDFQSLKLSVE